MQVQIIHKILQFLQYCFKAEKNSESAISARTEGKTYP